MRRKCLVLFLSFWVAVLSLYGCGDGGGGNSGESLPKWTIIVFMNDSNSISRELAGIDVYEMRRVGSSKHVNILLQRCSVTGEGMVRYFVGEGNLELLETLPQASPTSPETLLSFVNWCIENYSAEKYMLILWERDHPDIWSGLVEWDALLKVFSSFSSAIDLLVLDSSAKAEIELFDEVKNEVSFIVALQGVMPDDGFDYEKVFQKLVGNPSMGAIDVGKSFISNFKELYSNRNDVAISLISMAKLPTLLSYLDALGKELIDYQDSFSLWGVIAQTQSYFINAGEPLNFRDLYDFCEKLKDLKLSEEANNAIEGLKSSIKDAVLSEWHADDGVFSSSRGISAYISSLSGKEETYGGFAIVNDAQNWYDFLKERLTGL
ncbi:MAG: hypothetical protein H5T91_06630 [Synergistetes bacterium]|nr:MAG: Peptidase C11 clostripain [bacterium 42_11]MBC7332080.1 hypothetical protein [Synergistota bacterium]MDK2871736.1 hypothetical protein [bacterium]